MRSEFQRALAAAEDHRDPDARIGVIKKAVAAEVRAADPAVSVRTTDYFNHSFAPDMVLRWPREERERFLFVRPSAAPAWLIEELPMVAAQQRPMLFTLEDLDANASDPRRDGTDRAKLAAAADESETWITDPSGIAAISSGRAAEPVLGLLGQALVRGGKGIADGREVSALARTTTAGFGAAAAQSAPPTREAVEALRLHLDDAQSGRLTRVLRAVWEGHGGSIANFPSSVDVGRLTDDDLTYLLTATSDAPREFWRRIGRTLTTEQLGRVRVPDSSPSLHALVSANLDSLQAKGLRVVAEPHQLGESEDVPRWVVARGCLAFRGLNWIAYLAGRRVEELPPADEGTSPDLETLRNRATSRRSTITRVQFGRGDRAITYEARDGVDVMNDPELSKLASDVRGATVESATATLATGGTVNIDFPQKTAVGPTSSAFPVGALTRSVLPIVAELTDDELASIASTLTTEDPADTLFPDVSFD